MRSYPGKGTNEAFPEFEEKIRNYNYMSSYLNAGMNEVFLNFKWKYKIKIVLFVPEGKDDAHLTQKF